jgi:molybdopterin molybdotransferase
MLSPGQADELIGRHLTCLPTVSLPLLQCAGAVLREDIHAERDQPPFDRVAMDGIALQSAAVAAGQRHFQIQATQAAGEPALTLASAQHCIEVMTGTPLPVDCDCVVPVEQIGVADGHATLMEGLTVAAGQHLHHRGTDARQGELLLCAGMRLGAPQIAVVAAAGKARVRVASQPMVAVLSTGNELIEPGEPILDHQVRRSNAYAIAAALELHGYPRIATEHLRDDAAELESRLKFHLETHDVLVLSGGVSMGKLDLGPQVLESLGVRCVFHKVAQRPGKPLWFGMAPSGAAVLALPGNPVAAAVCVSRYVLPALAAAQGLRCGPVEQISLAEPVTVTVPLTFFLPVQRVTDAHGCCRAMPKRTHGSGDFTSLAATDGFVQLPPGPNTYPAGFVAPLYRW